MKRKARVRLQAWYQWGKQSWIINTLLIPLAISLLAGLLLLWIK
jgi:hypothetical protein